MVSPCFRFRDTFVCRFSLWFPLWMTWRTEGWGGAGSASAHVIDFRNALYQKFETNIPRNETARPHAQFLHSCIYEQFTYSHDRSTYFAVLHLILWRNSFEKSKKSPRKHQQAVCREGFLWLPCNNCQTQAPRRAAKQGWAKLVWNLTFSKRKALVF
jgi:hypothetical protein